MKNMATMFGVSMFLGAAVLPRLAGAWSWAPMKTEALKACMVEFAKENGHAAFAERIAAEKDLTSWIEETIEYAEKGLARCEGADYRDARRHALLRLVDYPTHIDSYSTNTPVEVRKAWFVAMDAQSRRARKTHRQNQQHRQRVECILEHNEGRAPDQRGEQQAAAAEEPVSFFHPGLPITASSYAAPPRGASCA